MRRFVFKLPDVGEGTAEVEIVKWHVAVGEAVKENAPLVDVMTDKATVEITAPVDGRIAALHGAEGDRAAVGSKLAEFEVEAEPEDAPAPVAAVVDRGGGVIVARSESADHGKTAVDDRRYKESR